MDGEALHQWLALIDHVSYYELFDLPKGANYDELRVAFHAFAEAFHPDGHVGRSPQEREAISSIFKRGTEAYRVLSDATLRARYDAALAQGITRPDLTSYAPPRPPRGPSGQAPVRWSEAVRTPTARPFVLRAEELVKKGDLKQAKLQLVMAMHLDPNNPDLERIAEELARATPPKR